MTPSEQEAVKYAKQYVGVLFPKSRLIERLKDLGADDIPVPKPKADAGARPSTVRVHIRWVIRRPPSNGGDVYVTIWFQAVQGQPWSVSEYSMHFGPTPRERNPPTGPNYYFRVCDNSGQGHHFHHHRFQNAFDGGHIPAEKSRPRIPARVDPDWFLSVLDTYLTTNNVPIEVIP